MSKGIHALAGARPADAAPSAARIRRRATLAIVRRELRAQLRAPGLLVALGVALAAASLAINNVLAEVAREGLVARVSPLYFPLFVATAVLSFALAVFGVTSVARAREAGTLETLFYGPVDAAAYVIGTYAAHVLAYLALCPLLLAAFAGYAALTNLAFSADLLPGVLLSALAAACTAAFGIFLSTFCAGVRSALLVLVGTGAVLIGAQGGSWLLTGLPNRGGALALVADTLAAGNRVVALVSPYAYFDRGMTAALLGDAGAYGTAVGSSLLYAACLLGGAIWSLNRRGVRRNEE